MGYGRYTLNDGREAGYLVAATCDRDGCEEVIDRGLGYLCGVNPTGWDVPTDYGCGGYYCATHDPDHDCPNPTSLEERECEADGHPNAGTGRFVWASSCRCGARFYPSTEETA